MVATTRRPATGVWLREHRLVASEKQHCTKRRDLRRVARCFRAVLQYSITVRYNKIYNRRSCQRETLSNGNLILPGMADIRCAGIHNCGVDDGLLLGGCNCQTDARRELDAEVDERKGPKIYGLRGRLLWPRVTGVALAFSMTSLPPTVV
jgi:hypothetical protein